MALSLLAKSAFSGEFPLTAQFRAGPRSDQKSWQHWEDRQIMPEGYPVDLQTNILRFSPNNYEYANRFADENPNMLILSTWRAASGLPKGVSPYGDPLEESLISFPGHFVLSPGSPLKSSISSNSQTLTVESSENMIKGPALVVETRSNGEKRWDRYEYVLITKVDGNKLTVKRQFNGSTAREFPAGTYVAPMPWDDRSKTPYINFFFNLSEGCPLDDEGRTAMEVMFEDMLYPLAYGGELEHLGGLDLASGPLTATPNNADYDVDGVADLDSWEEVSRTVNDMLAWNRLATLPLASIVFSQYYDKQDEPLRIQLQRMLNGYASCLGMTADIEQADAGEAVDAIQRIELYKGDEREAHWLGRSLGIKRPAEMTSNLLGGASSTSDWDKIIPALSVLRGDLSVDGDELVLTPWEKEFPGYVTLDLNFELDEKADFTVFMEALSDDDQLMRKIYLPRVSVPFETGPVRAGISSKDYLPVSFYVRGAQGGQVMIDFRFGRGGPIRFRKLSVHKSPDTLACEFEKGVVLVNPSLEEASFDLTEIFPDRKDYRRLSATAPQGNVPEEYMPQFEKSLQINNGRVIDKPSNVKIGERNALFLIANDASVPRPPTIDPFRGVGSGSKAPTAAPVAAPTIAPVVAPTDSPVASPTEEFRFEISEGVYVGCNWVTKRETEFRCSRFAFDGTPVNNLCPAECSDYTSGPDPTSAPVQTPTNASGPSNDTDERFELKNGNVVSCNWPARKKPEKRCYKETAAGDLIKDLCPDACASV